jgi:hypothetical protein
MHACMQQGQHGRKGPTLSCIYYDRSQLPYLIMGSEEVKDPTAIHRHQMPKHYLHCKRCLAVQQYICPTVTYANAINNVAIYMYVLNYIILGAWK